MNEHACEVLLIGCGPTGAVLANLLAGLGVRVVAIERDLDVYPVCRATHLDEETLRNFGATGLLAQLLPHTAPFGAVEVVDEDGAVLLAEEVRERGSVHGAEGSRFFDQPAFERALRAGLARYAHASLLTGVAAESLESAGREVAVCARDEHTGEALRLRASWVVGCDGGRSFTREALGVAMRALAPDRHWLIVDTALKDPADAARLPPNFRYVLDRERLTIYAHGFGLNRRWEFQRDADEAPPDPPTLRRWLARFIDPERLEVLRVVPYVHRAMVAERWRVGRVLLAGDAAHLMPPSAGQGLCSGVRDAVNLAWKLQRVVTEAADASLLDTYQRERARHVREVLAGALFIGDRLEARTALQRWRRRSILRLMARLPATVQDLVRRRALRHPVVTDGCFDPAAALRGQHVPGAFDEVLGYRLALIARDDVLDPPARAWSRARGVTPLRARADLHGALDPWLDAQGIDFALVRPDRLVFGAGTAASLPRAQRAFDVSGPRAASL